MRRPDPEAVASLPRLLVGRRRRHFAQLVATGLGQAALVVLTAFLMPTVLTAPDSRTRGIAVAVLAGGALALGFIRYQERLFAERLGQDYVQQIRTGLVASSLAETGPNLGITVARTTNDLNSVRNWIALGVTPIVVGVPVIFGTLVAVWILHPLLALAVGVPMAVLAGVLGALARPQYERSRQLRRVRGGLAAQVSDTVQAAESIRAGGGLRREVRRIQSRGQKVADAAVARAEVAGMIRGAAMAATGVATVAVAAVGAWSGLPGATIATALTVVGVLAGPVNELGRVVEYRQSYRAARRIIAPALALTGSRAPRKQGRRDRAAGSGEGGHPDEGERGGNGLCVRGLVVDGTPVPDLVASPGDVVVVRSRDAGRRTAVLGALAGLTDDVAGEVTIAGEELLGMSGERRRTLVGHASRGVPLERGSVTRLVRYQRPGVEQPVSDLLGRVGLAGRVGSLPKGRQTQLKRGGDPLSLTERGQLRLARALYGDPALVVLDHLDDQIGPGNRRHLRHALAAHAGITIVASDAPDAFLDDFREWDLDQAGVATASRAASLSR